MCYHEGPPPGLEARVALRWLGYRFLTSRDHHGAHHDAVLDGFLERLLHADDAVFSRDLSFGLLVAFVQVQAAASVAKSKPRL